MVQRNRRSVLVASASVLTGFTAGCSSISGGNDTTTTESETEDESDTETRTEADVSEDKTEVRFWPGLGGGKLSVFEEMVEEFNEQSEDYQVTVNSKGDYNETMNQVISAVNSGDPPAVAQFRATDTIAARDSGAFQPVENALEDIDFDKFLDPLVDFYTLNDTIQAIPFNPSTPITYYNVDMIEEAGEEIPDEPTFDDISRLAEAVVEEDVAEYGAAWPNHPWFLEQWFNLENETLVNNENGRSGPATEIHLDKDIAEIAFEWQNDLYQDEYLFNSGDRNFGEARQAFLNEDAAVMLISTAGLADIIDGAEEAGFEVDVSRFPAYEGRTGFSISGGSLWTPKGLSDDVRAGATEFLNWMVQPEQQSFWHQNTGYYPAREDSVEQLEDEGWFDDEPRFRVGFDQLLDTEDTPATRGAAVGPYEQMRSTIEDALAAVYDGNDISTELSDAKSDFDEELEQYQNRL